MCERRGQRSPCAKGRGVHGEAVELAANIMEADIPRQPARSPFIPKWSRVQSAFPDLLCEMKEAVEANNAE
ncbi:hypothetical protein D1F64_00870 [Breoghania sp. L-A4]|nr:hypothetical protein D1F64_00870 [Breoghania sp. L-A4]